MRTARAEAAAPTEPVEPPRAAADLRMTLVGVAAWSGGLLGALAPAAALATIGLGGALGVALLRARGRQGAALTGALLLLVLLAVGLSTSLRHDQVTGGPLADLAGQRAVVRVVATVTADPRPLQGPYADGVWLRATVREVEGRGSAHTLRAPVLVLAPPEWADVALGSTVVAEGRLGPADGDDLAAVLDATGAPQVRAMQIIDELEPIRRGPYGGGMGYVTLDGDMDIALALRTIVVPTDRFDGTMWTYHL